jgi:transcriptional regulator with GAF, ATPase, and Fis domain
MTPCSKLTTRQYALQERPCPHARVTQELVVVPDSRTDIRWRRRAVEAAATGVISCVSLHLIKGPTAIGAMRIHADTAGAFTPADQHRLTHLATSAVALLAHIHASDTPRRISEDVQESLRYRDAMGVARGTLTERYRLDKHAVLNQLVTPAAGPDTTIRSEAPTIITSPGTTNVSGSL